MRSHTVLEIRNEQAGHGTILTHGAIDDFVSVETGVSDVVNGLLEDVVVPHTGNDVGT